MCINSRDELFVLDLDKVAYIQASGNYSRIVYIGGMQMMITLGLSKLEGMIKMIAEQNYKLWVQKILDSISELTSWKNTVSPLINLRLFGFLLMDLMMATIMLHQIPTRNTTCINIPLKGN